MSRPLKIYFFLNGEKPPQADTHALAQSLSLLQNVELFASGNWWLPEAEADCCLFHHDPDFDPRTADIVICSKASYRGINKNFEVEIYGLPEWLTDPGRRFGLVFLEDEDKYEPYSWYPPFDQFDLVLRTKFNRRAYQPANFRPWVLGVSDYVCQRAEERTKSVKKRLCVLSNFNATHPFEHALRKYAREHITPRLEKIVPIDRTVVKWDLEPDSDYDRFHWKQVGQFYNPAYHEMLAGAASCLAFCGDVIPGLPWNPAPMMRGGNKGRLKRRFWTLASRALGIVPRSLQWDSFRFWECLAFACCPIHVDLEKYGVQLPVMPRNWEHYVGLDLEHLDRDLKRIEDDPQMLVRIGAQGRQWLLDNYAGEGLARLLFNYLRELPQFATLRCPALPSKANA